MVDCLGRTVKIGERVIVMTGREKGRIGYVHKFSSKSGEERAQVTDLHPSKGSITLNENWEFAMWAAPEDITSAEQEFKA